MKFLNLNILPPLTFLLKTIVMKKTLNLILSVMFLCPGFLFAQDINVTGKVTGPGNENLSGVNVTISGTNRGTVTNESGNFSINAPRNATLIFSFVGYIEQRVNAGSRNVINVKLATDTRNLQDVVVTALGIRKESKRLGYATATVNADQISTNRTPNVASGLEGKLAGVNISTMGTGPAGSSKIRIRGQSSFSSQNSPLIVINGVPLDNTNFGIGGGNGARAGQVNSTDGGDVFGSLNPDDIESMTVLKGATASALYGSRAKDGVVMITTKNRGSGKGIGVEYNINYTEDTPLDYTDFQYEYGQGERGVRPTTAFPQSGVWSFGEKFQPGMTQVLFSGDKYPYEPVHDRYKKFYNTGTNLTNTITLSTAGDKGGLSLSLSNTSNKGIIPNSKFSRRSANLGFTQNITKNLSLFGNVNYSNEKNTNP